MIKNKAQRDFDKGDKARDEIDRSAFKNLVINQESDIVVIVGGLQCIINTCLDIKDENRDKGFHQ